MRTVAAARRFSRKKKRFHQHFFFFFLVPLFKTKVETPARSALQKELSPSGARRLQMAAPLSEPPLRSFGRKSGKKNQKGKSDTLVELGVSVCQSVKCVCVEEKPAARARTHARTPSLPS